MQISCFYYFPLISFGYQNTCTSKNSFGWMHSVTIEESPPVYINAFMYSTYFAVKKICSRHLFLARLLIWASSMPLGGVTSKVVAEQLPDLSSENVIQQLIDCDIVLGVHISQLYKLPNCTPRERILVEERLICVIIWWIKLWNYILYILKVQCILCKNDRMVKFFL